MSDILREIITNKRSEIQAAKSRRSQSEVEKLASAISSPRNMFNALSRKDRVNIISECKKKSPSRGIMKQDYDPVALAGAYERGGAAAISVLTDEKYFGGSLRDLENVKASVQIPILRKDFIIDPYQIYEARASGADSFLLIAGTVAENELFSMIELGQQLGMEPLIESHSRDELELMLTGPGRIFGINNRNLSTFSVDLDHARSLFSLSKAKNPEIIMVCESGIHTRKDIENMQTVGYNVFLIGEALVTNPDPEAHIKTLMARS